MPIVVHAMPEDEYDAWYAERLVAEEARKEALSKTFTEEELMYTLPTLTFTKDAPFSNKDLKVMLETVKDGKYTLATPQWVTVPTNVEKWQ